MNNAALANAGYWLKMWEKHGDNFVTAAGRIIAILAVYVVAKFVISKLISGLIRLPVAKDPEIPGARKARIYALQTLLRSAAGFILGFIVIIMLLQAAGINIYPVLTTAGVAGLAVGMGAQKLVKDVISGFFILMEDQYGVGDQVTIGAVTGVVEELGMRTTRIRDAAGKLYIISNGDIAQVCNHSRGEVRIILDIAVAASADIDRAQKVMDEAGKALAKDMPELVKKPFTCQGIAQMTGAAATIRMAGSVVGNYQDRAQLEMNARIREALQKNEIPLA